MADALFNASLKIDTSQFEAALHDYARFDKRTLPQIITAKLGDWAWDVAKVVPFANAQAIRAIHDARGKLGVVWWRFVNTVINNGFRVKGRRKATAAEAATGYIDPATGERRYGQKTKSYFRDTAKSLKANDYITVSKSILRRRAGRAKAMRAQFLYVAGRLGKNVRNVGDKNFWKQQGILVREAEAHGLKPSAAFSIPFGAMVLENRRHDGDRSARENKKVSIAFPFVESVKAKITADMRAKTAERYARQAAAISRRGGW
jgi:hypothetical protein